MDFFRCKEALWLSLSNDSGKKQKQNVYVCLYPHTRSDAEQKW